MSKENSKGSNGFNEMSSGLINNIKNDANPMPKIAGIDSNSNPKREASAKVNLRQLRGLFDAEKGKI